MIHLVRLRAGTLGELARLGRTENPEPWVAEAERFIFDFGSASIVKSGVGEVLLILDDETLIGAATHRPNGQFLTAQHIPAFVIDPEHRGKKLARPALEAVVARAHEASKKEYVTWAVHEENAVMRHVSEGVAGELGFIDGVYHHFTHDA